jgi:hypothetical protein
MVHANCSYRRPFHFLTIPHIDTRNTGVRRRSLSTLKYRRNFSFQTNSDSPQLPKNFGHRTAADSDDEVIDAEVTGVARVQESHKGHDIVIEEPERQRRAVESAVQEPELLIDGRPVAVIGHADGTYSSAGVYYKTFASLSDLARASIDTHLSEG